MSRNFGLLANAQPPFSAKKLPGSRSIVPLRIVKEERGKDLHLGMSFFKGFHQNKPRLVIFMGMHELDALGFQVIYVQPSH
jgi:hypothetical protein